jgi:hypothetical protein
MKSAVWLGYTCVCREYVRVFELKRGEETRLPHRVTVACRNGHTATFNAQQVGLLELVLDEAAPVTLADDESEHAA